MTDSIVKRLLTDLPFYAKNQLHIKPKTGALVPFVFNRAQEYLHSRLEAQKRRTGKVRAVILKGRQQGCSTYVAARFYHNTTTKKGTLTFIFAHDAEASGSLYGMVKTFYESSTDPKFRPARGNSIARELLFPLMASGYKVGTAGTTGLGRSKTFQQVHWSEVAYSANCDEHAAGIMQTVPDAPGTEIILESTANGQGDYFHRAAKMALSGEGDFELIFIPWYWQPEYTRPVPEDFQLDEHEQEYLRLFQKDGLTHEHLAWRRNKIAVDFQHEEIRFKREYPFTPEEAFEASDENSFIKALSVRAARNTAPVRSDKAPLILGVDPARMGGDKFKIVWRRGRLVFKTQTLTPMRTDESSAIIAKIIKTDQPMRVNIDAGGLGVAVYDNLVGAGYARIVRKVDFGSRKVVDPEQNYNRRAEMYRAGRDWLADEPCSIQLPEKEGDQLQSELSAMGHKYINNSILLMEPKEDIKKRLGYSPDLSDAFVLTFAEDVAPEGIFQQGHGAGQTVVVDTSWNPFK